MLLANNGGMLRFRKGQLVIFGLMMAFSLVMLAVEFFVFQSLDVVMILVVAFIALTGGFLLFGMPAYLRRNAGRAYDQSVLGGHEYYGMVYVYEDRLEKVSGGTVNRVYYGENAAYIETGDMMVLLASSSRAIVLPARCMTREDAELVRRTVLPRIPPMRQRLLSKMVPQASQRMAPPPAEGESHLDEELMAFSVTYTPEEFLKLVGDTTTRSFLRMLPVFSALSLFSGVMFGLLSGIGVGVGAFLLILGVLFLLNVVLPRSRAKRSLETMQQDAMTIRLSLTERGLVGSSVRPGEETRIAWVSLQHAETLHPRYGRAAAHCGYPHAQENGLTGKGGNPYGERSPLAAANERALCLARCGPAAGLCPLSAPGAASGLRPASAGVSPLCSAGGQFLPHDRHGLPPAERLSI